MASKLFNVDIDLSKNQLLNAVIQVLASAPGTPSNGQIYYNSVDNKFYGYNGTSWVDLSSQGAGSTDISFSRDGTTVTVISNTGNDAILPAATTSLAGVMSATDKTKLDSVASEANNYTHPNHSGDVTSAGDGATTIANDVVTNAKLANVATATIKGRVTAATGDPEDLTAAQVRTLINVADGATANAGTVTSVGITPGTGISVSGSPITESGSIIVTNSAPHVATNIAQGTRTSTSVPVTSSTGTGATLDIATTSFAGVMSSADKTKLDGIETNAKDDQIASEVPYTNTISGLAAANVQAAIDEVLAYSNSIVAGALINKGGYNASTNSPNLDVSPIGGIKNGWTYVITAAGTFFTEPVQIGDMIIANQDAPTVLAHWTVVNKNIPDIVNASETDAGIVEEATDGEITAGTNIGSTGAKLFVTPGKLKTTLNTATAGLSNAVKFTQQIGNGSNTSFTLTHNIGSQFNVVQIYATATPWQQIECEVNNISTTQCTLKFNVAPTTNQYTVIIIG